MSGEAVDKGDPCGIWVHRPSANAEHRLAAQQLHAWNIPRTRTYSHPQSHAGQPPQLCSR